MLTFRTDQTPPKADKPHICADGQTIIFTTDRGNRVGYAEEGHVFGVAAGVFDYMQRQKPRMIDFTENLPKARLVEDKEVKLP